MKTNTYIFLASIILLSACGKSDKKTELANLKSQQKEIEIKIKALAVPQAARQVQSASVRRHAAAAPVARRRLHPSAAGVMVDQPITLLAGPQSLTRISHPLRVHERRRYLRAPF